MQMTEKKNYKGIKKVLKAQIKNGAKLLWTWTKGDDENFVCIYKSYNDKLLIYTPQQLIDAIDEEIN